MKICIVNPLRLDAVFVIGIVWPLEVATPFSVHPWDCFHLSGPPSSHSPSPWPIRNIPNDQLAMFLCIHGNCGPFFVLIFCT